MYLKVTIKALYAVARIIFDRAPGGYAGMESQRMIDQFREGDGAVVWKMDRIFRSLGTAAFVRFALNALLVLTLEKDASAISSKE